MGDVAFLSSCEQDFLTARLRRPTVECVECMLALPQTFSVSKKVLTAIEQRYPLSPV